MSELIVLPADRELLLHTPEDIYHGIAVQLWSPDCLKVVA